MSEVTKKVEAEVKRLSEGQEGSHDWHHVRQVRDMALRIAGREGGDTDVIELAALTHDVGDRKFHGSEEEGLRVTQKLLLDCGVHSETVGRVMDIVKRVSFKGAGVADDMPTLEGQIVQDADRLYALGAIGIARVFAYGGSKGRPLFTPEEKVVLAQHPDQYYGKGSSSLVHFYEKLLHLKERLHTKTAREIGERRDAYLRQYLERFLAEWDATD